MNKVCALIGIGCLLGFTAGCLSTGSQSLTTSPAVDDGEIVMRTAAAQHTDPFEAGRAAALALKASMGTVEPHALILTECFEEKKLKSRVLKGVGSVFPKDKIFGFATYGSFSQGGPLDMDSVSLVGIGGSGISISAVLEPNMGVSGLSLEEDEETLILRLGAAGERLARQLRRTGTDRLLLLMADAHSPKNQLLIDGVQKIVGKRFAITGGSVNKNAGQSFLYFRGRIHTDGALAILLSGNFKVALSGRQAKSNEKVISTAKEAAAETLKAFDDQNVKPFAAFAYNCAGRKGKLDRLEDELAAIQDSVGTSLPLFGSYCAGEFGPADSTEKLPNVLSSGRGWHVMFTLLGR